MNGFSLPKKSVRLIIVGLAVMVSGYILLMGGGSESLDTFNPAMFNFQRMAISPLLVVLGIVIIIIAIMRKPREDSDERD